MLKIHNNSTHLVSFGTTERKTQTHLDISCNSIANCDYFVRHSESAPAQIGDYLINEAINAQNLEFKIWGCSDMSTFIARKLAMTKVLGFEKFNELFKNIELIDIDPDIIKRAQKGLIGVTKPDFEDVKDFLDIDLHEHLSPVKNHKEFFLSNEPRYLSVASVKEMDKTDFCNFPKPKKVEPYQLSEELMHGLAIREGDIRQDLKNMQPSRNGTKRIFEFANGWYFMPPREHVNIAYELSRNMKKGDTFIIGKVELSHGVDELLNAFGFRQNGKMKEVFKKVNEMPLIACQLLKSVFLKTYQGHFTR